MERNHFADKTNRAYHDWNRWHDYRAFDNDAYEELTMVVAEALAGIGLVKAGIEAIKGTINTCNDVKDIASHIDKMFEGRDQIQRDRSKAANDPFSLKSVAEETINAKLAEEHFDEMRQLIDARFGFGTWQSIVAERARRIQEAKELEKQKRIAARKQNEELKETAGIVSAVLVGAVTILVVIWLAMTKGWR